MSLRPLGNRLIIKPDAPEKESAGGIIFPETHGAPPAMTGTVVGVGRGPASAHRVRQATLSSVLRVITEVAEQTSTTVFRAALEDRIAQMAIADVNLSEVVEGDYVCFAYTAGHNLQVDTDPYVVINEQDVQAVWTPAQKDVA